RPTQAGVWQFSVSATNSGGIATVGPFSITVDQVPAFTSDSPPATATTGVSYSFTFAAVGSPAPTFALGAGALPPGRTLAANASSSATPPTAGVYPFTVTAPNRAGGVSAGPFTVTVAAPNHAPAAVSQSVAVDQDTPKAIPLTASDPDGDALSF